MLSKTQQIPLDFVSRPAHGREDFLISPANQDAVSWIDAWPNWTAPALVIIGPAASGKTHLAAVWRDKAGASIVPPEDLIVKTAEEIADMAGSLVFDGIDPWIGDRAAETTLFHLYNIFREQRRHFLITMRMATSAAEFAVADLASRLRAAPVATIHPPDDDLLRAVLIKLFHDRQLQVSDEIIAYILPRMERSFVSARDIVDHADRLALAEKRKLSVSLMRRVLGAMQ